ncbi:MAG: hypothetical protein AB7D57_08550 [Desulfovibrionaceae bacterium]
MLRKWIAVALFVVLAGSLWACGGGDKPAVVAEKAMNAMIAGDEKALEQYVCKDLVDQAKAAMAMLKAMTGEGQGKIALSDMKYEAGKEEGDTVPVKVTGKIKGTHPQYGEMEDDIDEVFQVVKEDGKWRVCNGFL